MRNRILTIAGALLLVFTVACATFSPVLWHTMVLADTPPTDGSGIMIVFYKIADEQYLFWCDLNAIITDNGDSWDISSAQVNAGGVNKAYVDYDYFKYQPIPYGYNGTITDLGLVPPTADDLPHSEHIGKLVAFDAARTKPIQVRRRFMGVDYDFWCLGTQSIKNQYQAGTLVLGDYVLVSFIEEIPNGVEKHVAIVTDKVFNTWD